MSLVFLTIAPLELWNEDQILVFRLNMFALRL